MKQTKNKYFRILLIAGLVFTMQSCLKNNDYYTDFSKGSPAIELPLAAKYANKPYGISWSPDTTTSFKLYVNVASVDKPSSDVTATIGIDAAWVDQYNIDQAAVATKAQQDYLDADTSHHATDPNYPYGWTPMEVMPDSLYTISTLDLTVPAGQREVFADVLVKSDRFPPGHNYVLPFTITQSSINVSNWNHLPVWFISSPFAGVFDHYTAVASGFGINKSGSMTLATVDQHTVEQEGFLDTYSGSTTYHFLGDGSVEVTADSGGDLGASVIESHSDPVTGEFYVKYKALGVTCEETFNR